MKSMLRHSALALSMALVAASAHASLSVADLFHSGDGLLTVDSQAGLAWLDISQTRGLSVGDVVSNTDWLAQGFRFARSSDFDSLLSHGEAQLEFMAWLGAWSAPADVSAYLGGPTTVVAGVLAGDGITVSGQMRAATLLLTRDTQLSSGSDTLALHDLGEAWMEPTMSAVSGGNLMPAPGPFSGVVPSLGDFLRVQNEWVSPVVANADRGVFLVKSVTPVPEPSTLWLMGLGLMVMGSMRTCRQRSVRK